MRHRPIGTYIKRIGVGFLVGIGAVAPGVSGGAIAVIFGLYQEITGALAGLFRSFRRSVSLLLPLALGGAISIVLCGRLIEQGFANYPLITRTVFIGLMLGTLPSVVQDAGKQGMRWWYPLLSVLTLAIAVFGLKVFPFTLENATVSFPLMLLCGAVIGLGTIVPGISTSFTLISLGIYEQVLHAVNTFAVKQLIPLALGFTLFVLAFSKLIDMAYRAAYGVMSFLVIGLLLGSMVEVFPLELFHPINGVGFYWLCIPVFSLTSYLPLRLFAPESKKTEPKV